MIMAVLEVLTNICRVSVWQKIPYIIDWHTKSTSVISTNHVYSDVNYTGELKRFSCADVRSSIHQNDHHPLNSLGYIHILRIHIFLCSLCKNIEVSNIKHIQEMQCHIDTVKLSFMTIYDNIVWKFVHWNTNSLWMV